MYVFTAYYMFESNSHHQAKNYTVHIRKVN